MGREKYWSRPFRRGEKESAAGCMSGVLQFFDLQYCYMQQQQQSHACKRESLQGLEAPRNSLELEMENEPSSTTVVDDMQLGIQFHPKEPKPSEKDQLSETSSLQGSKTPNVVARLMGLDILPDQDSPRTSSPTMRSHPRESHRLTVQRRDVSLPINETTRYESGVRSLPDTPRISSARRSDVGPRLSLQLMNKETIDIPDFTYYSRSDSRDGAINSSAFSSRKSKIKEGKFYDENRSPSTYAREIVKQVKESVSRRVGLLDITNTSSRNRSGSDESISPTINARKMRKKARVVSEESKQSNPSTSSFSPRLKFLETKTKRMENKDPISTSNSPKPPSSSSFPRPHISPSPLSSSLKEPEKPKSKQVPKSTAKCKKASCERFTQRPSASSQTARKKCKTISNNLLVQIHPPSNVIQNPTQTVVSSQLPSGSSQQQYEEQEKLKKSCTNQGSSVRTTVTDDGELQYVKTVLESTAIDHNTTRSWFSPLDPSIFHHIEHSFQSNPHGGPLHHRCNRRLLFNLVDEILHEASKPWLERRKSPFSFSSTLIEKVVLQLRSFRQAKCETQQDIDGLVGLDLAGSNMGGYWCYTSQEEEVDSVVFEMERQIIDSLVQEVVLMMMLMKRSRPLNGVMVR